MLSTKRNAASVVRNLTQPSRVHPFIRACLQRYGDGKYGQGFGGVFAAKAAIGTCILGIRRRFPEVICIFVEHGTIAFSRSVLCAPNQCIIGYTTGFIRDIYS